MTCKFRQTALVSLSTLAIVALASPASGQSVEKKAFHSAMVDVDRHETRLTKGLRLSERQLASVDSLNKVYEPAFRDATLSVHTGMTPAEKAQLATVVRHLVADRERDYRALLSPGQRKSYDANKAEIAAFPRHLRSANGLGPLSLGNPIK